MVLTDERKKIAMFQAIFHDSNTGTLWHIFRYYIWHQEGENPDKITVFSSDS